MSIIWKTNSIPRAENQKMVIEYLKQQKKENPAYKVIDIGGAANPWADEVVDAYLDLFNVDNKNVIIGNLFDEKVWQSIKEQNFDFCICSHVLEDIRCPDFVIDKIKNNFNEGYISMPNKHEELSFIESDKYLGYCHHRWIFTIKDDKLFAVAKFPGVNMLFDIKMEKLSFKEKLVRLFKKNNHSSKNITAFTTIDWVDNSISKKDNDLAFLFKGDFAFEYIKDDFAGNGFKEFQNLYHLELREGL